MSSNNAGEIVVAIIITLSITALIVLIAFCTHFGRSNNVPTTYHNATPIIPIVPNTTHRTTIDRIPTSVIAPVPIGHHISHTSFCAPKVTRTLPDAPVHHPNNHSSFFFTKSGGDFGHGGSSAIRPSVPAHSMNHMSIRPTSHASSFPASGGAHHGGGGGGGKFGKH